jgi:hypothetical protein
MDSAPSPQARTHAALGPEGFTKRGSTFIYMGVAYIATQGGGFYVTLHMGLLRTECLLLGCKQSILPYQIQWFFNLVTLSRCDLCPPPPPPPQCLQDSQYPQYRLEGFHCFFIWRVLIQKNHYIIIINLYSLSRSFSLYSLSSLLYSLYSLP